MPDMKKLYLGGPGSGKTSRLIDHYLEHKQHPFETKGYFIVPTGEQVERITRLVLEKNNILFSNNIVTFNQLLDILIPKKPISEVSKQYILKNICKAPDFQYFQKVLQHNPFYEKLSSLIKEFKQYPEFQLDLEKRKHLELDKIFTQYQKYLEQNDLIDNEDKLSLAHQVLENLEYDFIIIDGFTSLTKEQQKFCRSLLNISSNIYISLLDLEHYADLKQFYIKHHLKIETLAENKRTKKSDLIHLADNFLLKDPQKLNKAHNIKILQGSNHIVECEQIAREILSLKDQHNYLWSDFVIILRQIGDYKTLIQDVFDFYEIPVTIHEGIYTHTNPFIIWLLNIIRLALEDYPGDILFSVLKSGFFDLDPQNIDQLELLAVQEVVFEGKDNWLNLSKKISTSFSKKLTSFFHSIEEFKTISTFSQLKTALISIIDNFQVIENLEKLINISELIQPIRNITIVYNNLTALLDELSYNQQHFGKLTLSEIYEDLHYFLTQNIIKVKEKQADQVQVYDMPLARQKEYKIVFIANLTNKSTPLTIKEDLFLKDNEKVGLKRSLDKQYEELYIFYQGLTRAKEKLYLTQPLTTLNGSKIDPSPYLQKIINMFEKSGIETKRTAGSRSFPGLENCLTNSEYKRSLIYHLYKNCSDQQVEELSAKNDDLKIIKDLIDQKNDLLQFKQYSAKGSELLNKLNKISAKELETFSRCRFAYFCEAVLDLQEVKEPSLHMPLGIIIHKVLEKFYQQKKETVSITALFDQIYPIQKLRSLLPFLHEKQLKLEVKKLKEKLSSFISADQELTQAILPYTPALFEQKLEFALSSLKVIGVADRVDKADKETLLIDYKTGRLPEINTATIKTGIIPQVWLYAIILAQTKSQDIVGCEYRQIPTNQRKGIYKESRAKKLAVKQRKNILEASEMEQLQKKTLKFIQEYLTDIKLGKFYSKLDSCPDHCQYKQICRMK